MRPPPPIPPPGLARPAPQRPPLGPAEAAELWGAPPRVPRLPRPEPSAPPGGSRDFRPAHSTQTGSSRQSACRPGLRPFLLPARSRMLLLCRPLHRIRAAGRPPSRCLMNLKELVPALNDFASLSLAESWDNVGLLVEPSPPHAVRNLLLTNDLTEPVMEEAVQKNADLILSYHPPIFAPLKRVTWRTWKERLVVRALEHRIGIYSPHTAYDAVPHGVNNWLSKGLGEAVQNKTTLGPVT